MSENPYETTGYDGQDPSRDSVSPRSRVKPGVVKWYHAYCIIMSFLYLLCTVIGFLMLLMDLEDLEMDPREAKIQGVVLLMLGIPLLVAFSLAPFFPRKSWAWIYGFVMIGIGMTSCCCLPASLPLLIFWIRPEAKDYFY